MGDNGLGTYNNNTNSNSIEPIYTFADTGTYDVTLILIGPNCNDTITRVVEVWDNPQITIINTVDVLCFGYSTGAINTNIFVGSYPYLYNWTSNNNFVSNNHNIDSLYAGNYYLEVIDSNNCTVYDTIIITEPTDFNIVKSQTNLLCYEDTNGTATVSVSGATPNYTYQWNTTPIQTTATATGLSAGTYSCTITDSNLCDTTVVFIITEPTDFNIVKSQTNLLCYGDTNGTATVSVSGATPNYTYQWNTTPIQTTATATGLSAGTYSCTITDSNLCDTTVVFIITEPTDFNIVKSQTNLICYGDTNGTATVSVSGATPNYTYQWNTTPIQTTATSNWSIYGDIFLYNNR